MVRTSSKTVPIMVGIVGRALPVDEKSFMYFCLFILRFGMTKFVITETP